ncbi:MAG: glycosyltransferase family 4 protein [bacterium]|nr:glycosyltransferase family 4 protein [bacterium]
MRILFFNYEYPPLGGGAGNAAFYLLREYSKIPDLTVDFITSSIDSEYHLEKMGENIFIHRLSIGKNENSLHFQSQKDILVYLWKAYFFSKKLAKKNKYDLSHSFFTIPCGLISLLLKRKFETPYIISLRGSDVPGYSERFSFLYLFIKPLIRKIWKNSFTVISNSQGLKNLALKTNPKQKIEVIFNGIDIDQFFQIRSLASVPEAKLREEFRILCVSRITPRKGVNYLIEAFKKLSEKHQDIFLQIIGDGDEKNELENLVKELKIENKVEFTGLISHEKLPSYFQSADVFVLPSLNEGMSNAMLEALASGLPIIATDTGGTRELVKDGENGFIVKMKDSGDIAEKIERLIENAELREKMGKVSREIAENMSWGKAAREYLEVYKKIK